MSSFFSRCLSCGIDLPNGCRFCGELCRERWHAKHDDTPVAIVATDEWPLVRRETLGDSWNNGRTPDVDLTDRQRQEPLGSSPNGAERVAPAVSHETVGQTIALRAETEGLGSTVALCSPDGLAPSRLHGSYCKCRRCDLAF